MTKPGVTKAFVGFSIDKDLWIAFKKKCDKEGFKYSNKIQYLIKNNM